MDSVGFTFVLFILFLFALFLIPLNNEYELFSHPNKNNIAGYCAPDFSKFTDLDNVAFKCIGNGNMTSSDCLKLKNTGQVCGVNRDTGETYPCQYYTGNSNKRCQ